MTFFKHCPACGNTTITVDSEKSIVCSTCGFVYFFNAAAAVAAIITNDNNELLVGVRKHAPGKGMLDLPGGFVDPGESAETALRREISEELNLEIQSMEFFASAPNEYVYKQVTYITLDLAFICRVDDFFTLKAMDDIEDVVFIPIDQLDPAAFCFPSSRTIISAFIKGKSANI